MARMLRRNWWKIHTPTYGSTKKRNFRAHEKREWRREYEQDHQTGEEEGKE